MCWCIGATHQLRKYHYVRKHLVKKPSDKPDSRGFHAEFPKSTRTLFEGCQNKLRGHNYMEQYKGRRIHNYNTIHPRKISLVFHSHFWSSARKNSNFKRQFSNKAVQKHKTSYSLTLLGDGIIVLKILYIVAIQL